MRRMKGWKIKTAAAELLACFLLAACIAGCGEAAGSTDAPDTSGGASPYVEPTPAKPGNLTRDEQTFLALSANIWVDIYDPAYILTFDPTASTMTERNEAAGVLDVWNIRIEGNEIVLLNDLGKETGRRPFVSDGSALHIDFGEIIGIVTYEPSK